MKIPIKGDPEMSKYVYTCPDVIHDRKVAKVKALVTLGAMAALATASAVTVWLEERKDAKPNLKAVTQDD
jgi:hypothetical protein